MGGKNTEGESGRGGKKRGSKQEQSPRICRGAFRHFGGGGRRRRQERGEGCEKGERYYAVLPSHFFGRVDFTKEREV